MGTIFMFTRVHTKPTGCVYILVESMNQHYSPQPMGQKAHDTPRKKTNSTQISTRICQMTQDEVMSHHSNQDIAHITGFDFTIAMTYLNISSKPVLSSECCCGVGKASASHG